MRRTKRHVLRIPSEHLRGTLLQLRQPSLGLELILRLLPPLATAEGRLNLRRTQLHLYLLRIRERERERERESERE
eukprot:COSAG03_NODE_5100_length_1341_cov_1.802738_2_plen_75_part_01